MPLEPAPAEDVASPSGGAASAKSGESVPIEQLPGVTASGLQLALGLLLTGVYFLQARQLPHGASEFAYHPSRLDLFPWSPMRGFTPEQLVLHGLRLVLLAPALWLVARGLARFVPARVVPAAFAPRRARAIAVATGAASLALAALLLFGLFRGRAIYDDELTYYSQARLLAEGKLLDDSTPLWPPEPFTVRTLRGATGKYLFGEPLIQVPGLWLGLAPLAHLPLLAVALVLWYRLLARRFGDAAAALSLLLLAFSPMLLFTVPTGLSQTTALTCIVAAAYGADLALGARPFAGALLCGGALGLGLAVRAQSVVPFGGVLGAAALVELVRRKRWRSALLLVAAGAAGLALIALYDWRLSGNPLTLPMSMSYPQERYGFGDVHTPSIGYVHTVRRAFENLAVTLVRWNGWSLGWPASLGLVALWFRCGRPWRGAGVWLLAGAALVAFNFCYLSPGASDLGPIYYFELLLPFTLLGGLALAASLGRRPRATLAFLLVHLLVGTGSFFTEQSARLSRLVRAVHAPAEGALAGLERPALLFYEQLNREAPTRGWLLAGFPWRFRSAADEVLTYPRQDARQVALRRAALPDRACYYFRFDPAASAWQTRRCAEVEELLARPPLPSIVQEVARAQP